LLKSIDITKINMQSFTYPQIKDFSLDDWKNKVILGDCLEILKQIPDSSINLIVTSPPYADSRRSTYGGVHPDHYVEWFLPIATELQRVLKDDGTFILNIKEKAVDCERHAYVIELILALKQQGWLWTEEYIWHKKIVLPVSGVIAFEMLGKSTVRNH